MHPSDYINKYHFNSFTGFVWQIIDIDLERDQVGMCLISGPGQAMDHVGLIRYFTYSKTILNRNKEVAFILDSPEAARVLYGK